MGINKSKRVMTISSLVIGIIGTVLVFANPSLRGSIQGRYFTGGIVVILVAIIIWNWDRISDRWKN